MDFIDSVKLAAGEDKTVNFDMTRKEYIDKMTPEEKKQLEEYKKKNAEGWPANAKIANLNTLLTQARADTKAGNYDAAITAMTDRRPRPSRTRRSCGLRWAMRSWARGCRGESGEGGGQAADRSDDVAEVYAMQRLRTRRAIDAERCFEEAKPGDGSALRYNQLGQALREEGDPKDASDAYEQAAKAQPRKRRHVLLQRGSDAVQRGQDWMRLRRRRTRRLRPIRSARMRTTSRARR